MIYPIKRLFLIYKKIAASTFFEFANVTVSSKVYKFVAVFLPGVPIWCLLMTECKILSNLFEFLLSF